VTVNSTGSLGLYGTTGTSITRSIVTNTGATINNVGLAAAINSLIAVNGNTTFNGGAANTFNGAITVATGATMTVTTGGHVFAAGGITGAGGFTSNQTGTVTLSGANTFTGATTITAGRVNLTNTNTSSITVGAGSIGGTGSTTGNVTLNAGSAIALAGGTTKTGFTANGITSVGTTTVTFDALPQPLSTFTVMNYGAGGFTGSLSNFTTTAAGRSTFANTGSAIILSYKGTTLDTWNTTSGTWDTTSTNWSNSFGDNRFVAGDSVLFNEPSAVSTITITGTVTPVTATFNNSTNAYSLAGGAIGGAAALIKNGVGTLNIGVQQSYTGGTTINGGTLSLNANAAGGSEGLLRGTVTINTGGTLQLNFNDATGYGTGNRISVINLNGGTLHNNVTTNQTLGSAVINMTGGSITGIAGGNLDFFAGASALNTFASNTTSAITGTKINLRQNNGVVFNVSKGSTVSGIDLNVTSEVSNTAGFTANNLTKTGLGTMQLTAANSYTTGTVINGGTLQLGFGTVSNNIINSGSALTLGGGTLKLTGTGTQTLAGLTTTANTGSRIELASANETLTLGALTAAGTNSALNFNTAAGTANATTTTVGSSIIMLTGPTVGSAINSGFTVTDAGGFGLATVNGANQVVRLTTTDLLLASGTAGATNYLVDNNAGGTGAAGSSSLNITASQSTNSVTVDTTAAAGTLTLATGVTLSNNVWNFGGTGTNGYTITGGTALNSTASAATINFNNYNPSAVTIGTPILANGVNAVNYNGTGTTIVSGTNTYTGVTTVSGGGTLSISAITDGGTNGQLGAATNAVGNLVLNNGTLRFTGTGTTPASNRTFTIATNSTGTIDVSNAATTLTLNGGALAGVIAATSGRLVKTGPGLLVLGSTTIQNANNYTGGTYVNQGELQVLTRANAEAKTSLGTGDVVVENAAVRLRTGSTPNAQSYANNFILNNANLISDDGVVTYSGTINITGDNNIRVVWNNKNAIFSNTISGAGNLTVTGAATGGDTTSIAIFTGNNTYTGTTTITAGRTLNLGNGGATGNIGSGNVTNNGTLLVNRAGSITFGQNISGTGQTQFTGVGISTLTGTNTYTGATAISAGTVLLNGTQTGGGAYTVSSGTLGGTGSTTSVINMTAAVLAPGASIESLATGAVTMTSASTFAYELDTAALNGDLLKVNGALTLANATLSLTELAAGTVTPNSKLTLINYAGALTGIFNGYADDSTFTLGSNLWQINYNDTTGGSNTFAGDGAAFANFVTLTAVAVPEPSTLVLGGLALLGLARVGLRRQRLTKS
jgi:fibronectin-binding autotransporter adhesin